VLSLNHDRVIAGKYRLDRELASGGMGSLWIAFDRRLRRKVAIKFIKSAAAQLEELRVRFEREARAAAQIRSPHVVEIYDYGVDRGHAYIVMELLEGEDLSVRLAREKRIEIGTLTRMLGQMAKGLDAVHAAGIVHRDLKPANVFLALVAGEETIKLLDFGVARANEPDGRRMTGRGALVGTVKYMSPEQARGDITLDYRTDLWALTVIMYRLLTGKHPFFAATIDELLLAISKDPIEPPSRSVANLPPAIDVVFERAFMRDPSQRFHSAQQMATAFANALTGVRNVTIPWGAKPATEVGPSSESESALALALTLVQVQAQAQVPAQTQVQVRTQVQARTSAAPREDERQTRPEPANGRPSFGSRESQEATLESPNALPALKAVLPSSFTPIRRSWTGDDSGNRWWWASVPAALVVVAAVVVGMTVRTRTSMTTTPSAPSASTQAQSPQATPPSR
jgi:serine/threonine protein kinase